MYLSGFADEAADDIENQIKVTKELGWNYIEARQINHKNISTLSEEDFDFICQKLKKEEIKINCFASTIANWQKTIDSPLQEDLKEVRKAITRMKKLKTKMVRIMSYAPLKDQLGNICPEQREEEIFRRLRIICKMFSEEGILPVHENCMTYGGLNWQNTMKLIHNVPGLSLVYDTGNPLILALSEIQDFKNKDINKNITWEFYSHVKEHISYIHIKDCRYNSEKKQIEYTFPGEGQAALKQIIKDLFDQGYDGGFSIEPHMTVVFHDPKVTSGARERLENYFNYGRYFMKLLGEIEHEETKKNKEMS